MSTSPLCPHFGECGGCATQDQAYEAQIEEKSRRLTELLSEHWSERVDVLPSPRLWHYRNKVELNFARKRYPEPPPPGFVRETVLGFKRRGAWFWTLDIAECRIGPEGLDELMGAVRRWAVDGGLAAWDGRRAGCLRHLVVRVGHRTGERMVVLITRPGEIDRAGFVETVHGVWPDACVLRGVNAGKGDQASADEVEVWSGEGFIEEALVLGRGDRRRRFRFRISPFGFFQTNTEATEVLYERARDWVADVSPRLLLDLYGGSGGIAFACADLVDAVESVESWAPASEDGRFNAGVNRVGNVTFTTDSVERYLGRLKVSGEGLPEGAAVVLDPPRSGLHPKALRRLVELAPERVLYISCKPSVLAQELAVLSKAYDVRGVVGVDLFPHTPHTELLVSLARR